MGSETEKDIKHELQQMVLSGAYNTASSYIPTSAAHPDGLLSFVEKHLRYLNANPKLEAGKYLANLRLMTRIKRG